MLSTSEYILFQLHTPNIVVLNKIDLLTRKDTDHVFSIELFTEKTQRAGSYTFCTFVFVIYGLAPSSWEIPRRTL